MLKCDFKVILMSYDIKIQALFLTVPINKLVFLLLNRNICCVYSKEPSQETVLLRTHNLYVKTDGLENIYNFTLNNFVYLNL